MMQYRIELSGPVCQTMQHPHRNFDDTQCVSMCHRIDDTPTEPLGSPLSGKVDTSTKLTGPLFHLLP